MGRSLTNVFLNRSQPEPLVPCDLILAPTRQRKRPTVVSRMLSTAQAAKYLGMGQTKFREMVHSGEIPVIRGKYWKFDVRELDKWIERNKENL